MVHINEIRSSSRPWAMAFPISNLRLGKSVNHEMDILNVTFISSDRLSRRAKRLLGSSTILGNLSSSKSALVSKVVKLFMEECETLAIVRRTGTPDSLLEGTIAKIQDACSILSLSQITRQNRQDNSNPSVIQGRDLRTSLFLDISADEMWFMNKETAGPVLTLNLDERWSRTHRQGFFPKLLKVLHRQIKVSPGWRSNICNAAILAGQSQASFDIAQSFLWNMIAIELLLTSNKDSCSKELPHRARAFFGWVGNWQDIERKLVAAYKKRCELVHEGRRDKITRNDVLFTDNLLLNLFENILRNIGLFSSKEAIMQFSEKVEAEQILGIRTSRVRPKAITFRQPTQIGHQIQKLDT
jgi:hypothetical protein